jgi:hypothetical protein
MIVLLGFAAIHHASFGVLFAGGLAAFISSDLYIPSLSVKLPIIISILIVVGIIGLFLGRRG